MANVLKQKIYIVIVMVFCAIYSCKDSCEDVQCENDGTCIDGTCACPEGYTGSNCETETKALFFGTYSVHDVCTSSGLQEYTINIKNDSNSLSGVKIANFHADFANDVNATIQGNNIIIPSQSPDGDGRIVSGNGQRYIDTLIVSYSVSSGYILDQCANSKWVK